MEDIGKLNRRIYMRSNIITVLLAAALALGMAGPAHSAGKTVGVVMTGDLPRYKEAYDAFNKEMARLNLGPDKVDVYLQTPNPDRMSWVNSVRKFVGVGANVIVTFGAPATLAALAETGDIPVVYAYVYDPISCGLNNKNATGVSSKVPMITLFKTLKSIKPFTKLAVIYNPDEKDSVVQLDEAKSNGTSLGFSVLEVGCRNTAELKTKVPNAVKDADAVFITCSAVAGKEAAAIMKLAGAAGKPTVGLSSDFSEKGALVSLGPSAAEQGEMAARSVEKLLSGGSPGTMPVESAKKIDLVLNLKASGALGLKIPFDVLNAATKVIK